MANKPIVPLLRSLYADNFVTYYKTHAFHFNVEGATFSQDHGLFGEIYDFLWAEHDNIGEQIRQQDKPVTVNLKTVLELSSISETSPAFKSNAEMLTELEKDVVSLLSVAQEVYEQAGAQCMGGLETYIGDYLKDLSKLHWKIKATLKRSIK